MLQIQLIDLLNQLKIIIRMSVTNTIDGPVEPIENNNKSYIHSQKRSCKIQPNGDLLESKNLGPCW